jgi:hypothetical protein
MEDINPVPNDGILVTLGSRSAEVLRWHVLIVDLCVMDFRRVGAGVAGFQ